MINNFLLSLLQQDNRLSTYSIGLIQAKAYRILKQRTNTFLAPYKLNSLDWAMLGLLFDKEDGFKSIELAELLGVEPPFVTVMTDELQAKKLIKRSISNTDKRVKIVTLSNKGRKLVPKIEAELRSKLRKLINGTSIKEVYGYVIVLKSILSNAKNLS